MDEIATKLGISKKTIYQYFSDKDELVESVVTGICEFNETRCEGDRTVATNAIHEIFLAMEMMKDIFQNMNPSILYDLERHHPKAFQKFLQHKHKYIFQMLKENVDKGIKEGLYREDLAADVMAKLRLETMMLSFNQDLFPKNKYNIVEVEQQIIEHYLFGLASLKGYKLILKYQQERIKNA